MEKAAASVGHRPERRQGRSAVTTRTDQQGASDNLNPGPSSDHRPLSVYSLDVSCYPFGSDCRAQPLSEDHREMVGRPLPTVVDVALSTDVQRLIALIARLPSTELKNFASAVQATLRARAADVSADAPSRGSAPEISQTPNKILATRGFKASAAELRESRCANGKLKLPALPEGLHWPRKKYARENKKHGVTIEQFLRREWRPLIDAGYGELRWLRAVDPSAVSGITNYERRDPKTGKRNRLPPDLRFLTEKEVTDRKISANLAAAVKSDPHLAMAMAIRIRRGLKIPTR